MKYGDFSGKFSPSAEVLINRAMEEASRRGFDLEPEHIFIAWTQKEWGLFSKIMKDFKVTSPSHLIRAIEQKLNPPILTSNRVIKISKVTAYLFKIAFVMVQKSGRNRIEPTDLAYCVFEINDSLPAVILRDQYGIDMTELKESISREVDMQILEEERLKKKFELPSFLKTFSVSLNMLVYQNKVPPLFGREKEMDLLIEILCHRGGRPNSAVLIGEPGIGKTAIVEGLARKIELEPETLPARLRQCHIVSLQMNSMVAGTMLRGMFEDRIQSVIRELKERHEIILLIDEFHTIVGAGIALGTPNDAANALKSVTAKGEIRIIGATTLGEYRTYVQKDEALARRFKAIIINEPTFEETRNIIQRLKPTFEETYDVEVSDEAISTLVELSPRYYRHLNSPDKQIGWLDTACTRAEIRESPRLASQDIINVIADTCKIPVEMVSRDVTDTLKNIEQSLAIRVVGQQNAIKAIADRIRLNKGPLKERFERPDGVFLFVGPTGVGKTELAKALSEFLFGDENKMIRIDMSEYQDGIIAVGRLIGLPSGIAGYEHGGILTNKIRDNPYSVILLDEIEKADFLVFNLLLQAFDEGWLTDGGGKRNHLSDSIIIMTSNIGSRHFRRLVNPLGFSKSGFLDINTVKGDVLKEVERYFSPEFRNRIDQIVFFSPLTIEEVRKIVEIKIDKLRERFANCGKVLEVEPAVIDLLAKKGYSPDLGARFLRRKIEELVSIPLSAVIKDSTHFHVCVKEDSIEINTSFVPSGVAEYQIVV